MKPTFLLISICCLFYQTKSEDEIVNKPPRKFESSYTLEARETFSEKEKSMAIGGALKLSKREQRVNDLLMHFKRKEYDSGIEDPEHFPPARHFFHSKKDIEASEVFSIIRKLPKGANLRTQLLLSVSGDYLYGVTLEDDLYICRKDDNEWYLRFFGENIAEDNVLWKKRCDWKLVKDMRENDPEFDDWLRAKLTMVVDDPYAAYPSSKKAWEAFEERFVGIREMMGYWPIFAEQFYEMLEELHEDNVMYVEFRSAIPGSYELNNTEFELDNIAHWKEVMKIFHSKNPSFFGSKVVFENSRAINQDILGFILYKLQVHLKKYQSFIAGLDLSGLEDYGRNLTDFAPLLKKVPPFSSLLLQAGETNWYGHADNNLIDAVLLGVRRIGHGLALLKHPEVLRMVKEKAIGIEVCPIANQIFRYVDDLRNHPAAFLFANDFPVVICNCAPGLWGNKGLSYDWYMAFMGIASRDADLRMLKQLALNSINYSSMGVDEKQEAFRFWHLKWNLFIDETLEDYADFLSNEDLTKDEL